MQSLVRAFADTDMDAVTDLSLRAWEPVFASLRHVLGESGLFTHLHADWRADQRQAVRGVCRAEATQVWVGETDAVVTGFVAVGIDKDKSIGEIQMIAVHPDHQGKGLGSLLTRFAVERIQESGMATAMVETGGDPGHLAARRTYEQAGFTELPVARYFKKLR